MHILGSPNKGREEQTYVEDRVQSILELLELELLLIKPLASKTPSIKLLRRSTINKV